MPVETVVTEIVETVVVEESIEKVPIEEIVDEVSNQHKNSPSEVTEIVDDVITEIEKSVDDSELIEVSVEEVIDEVEDIFVDESSESTDTRRTEDTSDTPSEPEIVEDSPTVPEPEPESETHDSIYRISALSGHSVSGRWGWQLSFTHIDGGVESGHIGVSAKPGGTAWSIEDWESEDTDAGQEVSFFLATRARSAFVGIPGFPRSISLSHNQGADGE